MTTFRSDNSAPPSPGDVTGPAPDPSLDVMMLNEAAAVLEMHRRFGFTPSSIASFDEMVAAIRRAVGRLVDAQGSRGDVTGTPAPAGTHAVNTFARVGDYAAAKTIGGKLLLVDETEEGTPIATFHSIADGVRFWRFVERLVSRPDLTGETPPVAEQGQ